MPKRSAASAELGKAKHELATARVDAARARLAASRGLIASSALASSYSRSARSTRGSTPELKINDVPIQIPVLQQPTPWFFLLNGAASGTGVNQRVGMRITVKSIQLILAAAANPTATDMATHVRFIIFYDRQTNGLTPNLVDVIEQASYLGLPAVSSSKRIVFVMDRLLRLTGNATTPTEESLLTLRWYKKVNIVTQFNKLTVADQTAIATNGLWALVVGSSQTASGPKVAGVVRVRYTDS